MLKKISKLKKESPKLSKAEKERRKRLRRSLKPSTQSAIYFTSLLENGLMHVKENTYSRTYKLGDVAYTSANNEDKADVMDTYAEALNSLDAGNNFQLLVINRKLAKNSLDKVLFELEGDSEDVYRQEYNDIISDRFTKDSKNFQVDKYVTIATNDTEESQAEIQLHEMATAIHDQFQELEIVFEPIDGLERLKVCHQLLQGNPYFPYNYKDIALSGLRAKDFISPSRFVFREDFIQIDKAFAKVMYINHFPTFLTDKLIHLLTGTGIEMAISIHAEPYEPGEFAEQLQNAQAIVKMEMVQSQRDGAIDGIDPELATSGVARETNQTTERWKEEIHENDQKAFSGVMAVYFRADSPDELKIATENIQSRGRRLGVRFEETYYYQKEGLNTILPIGQAFLNVKSDFMRPMTTSNIATQVPFTNVDLQSNQPNAIYYGQNQLSHNIITLDRKRDLNSSNGVILGSTGSGKGMTVKTTEIIPTLLKYPEDRIIIVDPENEYSDIGRAFNGQSITISPKSPTHLNLLDLPETEEVLINDDNEVIDSIADKANLLMGLFDSILKDLTDDHITIIDRVTRDVYKKHDKPTLVHWQEILREQPEESAQELAVKAEIYTTGSLNLFAHDTNVNLSSRLIVFNLKGLSNKLKPFALMVIQDYIWQQVIACQGKQTIRLYWDELHLTFRTKTDASFFAELWARIRKYGSIPTGITQNIGVILAYEEGKNLLSNSDFMILLKQKPQDIVRLAQVLDIPDALIKYIKRPKAKGTGLIVADSTIVPFENPIPKDTQLYQLTQTDA
ncbi:ATP-binding protein [Streptococcus parauberis]|uniref:VirB4-like conjugal transfer ATPase, CD1110 family n=1 Tax=Streptococcus parauberis TaxID=1348 RepID=UPI00288DD831|nr:ATP-binding protein [Streptococcus parauberis]MDT2749368.1 ATP-binding protein [Streptococcus parauberis]